MEGGRNAGRIATVTVVASDLVISTAQRVALGDDAADELAVVLDDILRAAVERHHGAVVKPTGDGLMATFGSATDAIVAAIDAHRATHDRNQGVAALEQLVLRTGITAGDVQFIANDCHGTPVVEAARLQSVAEPGSILVSALVRGLAGSRGNHRFEHVGAVRLKGFPDPVDAFSVPWRADDLQPPAAPSDHHAAHHIPLPARLETRPAAGVIGYAPALQTIAEAIKRVAAGEGREVVLILGEAGQGKTTVAAEAARRSLDEGGCVLFGHCDEELAAPYQLFSEALDHYVRHAPIHRLSAHVDAHGLELARLAPALARRVPGVPRSKAVDPETERFLVFAATTGLLDAAVEDQPVVLVFDDLQWADKASLQLLIHLVATQPTARLLVVGTIRDSELVNADALREALGALQRHAGLTRIELHGFDDGEVLEYMEALAGYRLDGPTEMALARAVHRETDGNPFFVGQVLQNLAETGLLYQDESGRWTVDGPIDRVALPDSVREVIGGRVVRLGRAAEQVLTLAAAIGRDFDLELLASASTTPAEDLIDMLDTAKAGALVREVPGRPASFQFAHALIQQTLYDSLGPTRRAWAHHRIATALEQLCADAPDARLGELARHWTAAEPLDARGKAIEYSHRAGDAALAALAPSEALHFFASAIELLGRTASQDAALAIDLAIGLGTAQRQTGEPEFRDTLLDAARRAIQLDDTPRLVAAALAAHRGLFSRFGAIDDERVAIFEQALTRVAADDPDRALILAAYALEIVVGSPLERRRNLADEALAIAETSGDEAIIVRVLNNTAYALMSPPMLEPSLVRTARGLERAARLGDPVQHFFAANWRRQACAQAGDIDTMDRCTEVMARLVQDLKQPTLTWMHTFGLAWLAIIRGDTDEAERLATAALEIGVESGQPDAAFIYGGQMVIVHYQRGVLDQLRELIEEMAGSTPSMIGVLSGALVAADLEAGRMQSAHQRMAVLAADGFRLEMNPVWISGMAFYAEAAIELDEPAFAAPLFELLAPWPEQWSDNGATAANPVSHFLGGLSAVLGRYDDAERYFQRAAAMSRGVGARFFLAQTELLWARLLTRRQAPGDELTARQLLARAHEAAVAGRYALVQRRAEEALASLGR